MDENTSNKAINLNAWIVAFIVFFYLIFSGASIIKLTFFNNHHGLTKSEIQTIIETVKNGEVVGPTSPPPTVIIPKANKTSYVVKPVVKHLVNISYPKPQLLHQIYKMYSGAINYASQQTGVPVDVITNMIYVESRGNPNAQSNMDAVGLMQLVPTTGGLKAYQLQYGKYIIPTTGYLENSWNNIVLGTKYFRYLLTQFKNYPYNIKMGLALASYNCGLTRVEDSLGNRRIENWKQFSLLATNFPMQTQSYITDIYKPLSA